MFPFVILSENYFPYRACSIKLEEVSLIALEKGEYKTTQRKP